MREKSAPISKITPPKMSGAVQRERLFRLLDTGSEKSVVWISAPAGSGKSTLVAGWLEANRFPGLWLRLDAGDGDPAAFFYYLGLAAQKANPRKKKPLPLLTPEYLMNVPTFSRRFFEELCKRIADRRLRNADLKAKSAKHTISRHISNNSNNPQSEIRNPKFIIVFDNYQEVPADSALHDLLLQGFESLPEGAAAIVISRSDPPPQFARLRANGRMAIIGWNELRFTLDEVKDAVKPWQRDHCLSRDCPGPDILFEKTDGWAAGLRLMIEAVEPKRKIVRSSPPGEPVCHCVESLAWKDNVFSYFACEVMSRADHSICDFLTATSFLPFMTAGIAEQLTGRHDAAAILNDLSRRNFFTEKHPGQAPVYQYHFLFQEFLQEQAQSRYGAEERGQIQRTGAELLEEGGFIEEAAGLFSQIGEYNRAGPLISRIARPLLAQGRSKAVEGLLAALPDEMLSRDPGLLHLAGLCRIGVAPRAARGFLEASLRLLKEKRQYAAAIPVCGAIIETILYETDNFQDLDLYIEWLDGIVEEGDGAVREAVEKISGSVLFALAYRSPDHRTLPLWLERAEKALTSASDAMETLKLCNHLMAYYLFQGKFRSVTRVMMTTSSWKKEAGTVPLVGLLCILLESFHAVFVQAATEHGIKLARRGLAWSKETGVLLYDFWLSYLIVAGAVQTGDLQTAEAFLQGMRESRNASPKSAVLLHGLSGNVAFTKGDRHGAVEHFRTALDLNVRIGDRFSAIWYRLCLAQAWYACGDMRRAREILAEASRENWAHSGMYRYQGLLTSALIDLQEDEARSLGTLREALVLGRQQNMMLAPFWDREMTALLLARALDAGIETEFVRNLIKKHRLLPPAGEPVTDAWPWPVRIYTLGGFRIFRNDVLLEFPGKAPQKPLELLKALIAFGGRSVPEERLTDALWPDADGDLARQSFETNLSRLRKLLDGDDCIKLGGRQLSLDPQRCWVDSIAFEAISKEKKDMPEREIPRIYEEAAGLYKGQFLPADAGREWVVSRSEALRSTMLRVSAEAGRWYEHEGQWENAVHCYRKGLDTDCLAEEFYHRLMLLYQKSGRRSDAVRLYNRCAGLFRTKLGIEPSAEIKALYSALLRQS